VRLRKRLDPGAAQFCLGPDGSDPGQGESTPSQCTACQEDYTCACIEQFNPYCPNNEYPGCFPYSSGAFEVLCGD
jgi:hypothetical protein